MFNTCCRHFYYPDNNLGYTDTQTSVSAQHCLDNIGRTVIIIILLLYYYYYDDDYYYPYYSDGGLDIRKLK